MKAQKWVGDCFFSVGFSDDGRVYNPDFVKSIITFSPETDALHKSFSQTNVLTLTISDVGSALPTTIKGIRIFGLQ